MGILESGDMPRAKKAKGAPAPVTVNQEILRAAGLVRTLNKPMKVLGNGDISTPLFVVADAVSGSARAKIEAAGGSVSILEVPASRLPALGLETDEGVPEDAAVPTTPAVEADLVVAEPPAGDPADD